MKFNTKFWVLLAAVVVVLIAILVVGIMSGGKVLAKHDGNGRVHNFDGAPNGCKSPDSYNWRVAAAELASGPGVVSHPLTDHKGSTYVRPKNRYDKDNEYSGDNDLANGTIDHPYKDGERVNGRDYNEDTSVDDGSTARVVGYWVKKPGKNWKNAAKEDPRMHLDWYGNVSTKTIVVNQSAKACIEQKVPWSTDSWQYWYILSPKVTRH